jgi:outer membrane lipoprotein-sorting protein
LLVSCWYPTCAPAQTADEIIAKNISARGGQANLSSVKTRRIHARVEANGQAGTLLVEQKRPSKLRTETRIGGETLIRAYDGSSAWELDPRGEGMRLSPDETGNMAREADFDGPLIGYRERSSSVEYAGRVKQEGRDAYKIKLRWKDGNVSYYYLSPDTGLETSEEIGRDLGGREVRFVFHLQDYRAIGNLTIPFRIDSVNEEAGESQSVRIDSVEINPVIDDARFSPGIPHRREGEIARKN